MNQPNGGHIRWMKTAAICSLAFVATACGSNADDTASEEPSNSGAEAIENLLGINAKTCGETLRIVVDYPTLECREGKTIDRYTIELLNVDFTVNENEASQADILNGETFFAKVFFSEDSAARDKRVRLRSDCSDYSRPRLNQWTDWQSPSHGGHSYYIQEKDGRWLTSTGGGYRRSAFQFAFNMLVDRPEKGIVRQLETCN